MTLSKIAVIGAGAWGTALAQALAEPGREITVWAREPDVVAAINEQHENTVFLPGIKLDESIRATDSLTETLKSDCLLIAVPAQYVRSTLQSIKADVVDGKPFVICAKGVEIATGYLMSQVVHDVIPQATFAILTGPTFASEIARGLPSAVTLAIEDKDVGAELVESLSSKTLRPYITDDVIGAQIGGAVKNVIAIACGVIAGLGMGESARAALVTRGLAEMSRLAAAMGARRETLMGMCGVGDLILTCSSTQSRNYSLGYELGQGKTMDEILSSRRSVTEGVYTAKALKVLAESNAVDMPIASAVNRCLNENADIRDVIDQMMDRPLRPEGA